MPARRQGWKKANPPSQSGINRIEGGFFFLQLCFYSWPQSAVVSLIKLIYIKAVWN
jgi:hypothetical protein